MEVDEVENDLQSKLMRRVDIVLQVVVSAVLGVDVVIIADTVGIFRVVQP